MSLNKVEYLIRLGPSDRYRHLHIKEKEMIERNIELSTEFSRYLFEHKEMEEKIPIDAEIILLPEFDEELKQFNLSIGRGIEDNGGKVTYVSIKGLKPKSLSRIEKIELETAA